MKKFVSLKRVVVRTMSRGGLPQPVFHTACCIIPPESLWGAIQEIRKTKDKAYDRWPPHINLLFPFWNENQFVSASKDLGKELEKIQPFKIQFKKFGYFDQGKGATVHLKPESSDDALNKLQKIVDNQFPNCNKRSGDFHGHLTVGQWPKAKIDDVINNVLQKNWKEIEFEVNEVYFISRDGDVPFEVRCAVPLGGGKGSETKSGFLVPKPLAIVDKNKTQVFVGSIPIGTSEADLQKFLEGKAGSVSQVKNVKIISNKSFGFLEMDTEANRDAFVNKYGGSGLDFQGSSIKVSVPK